MNRNLLTVFAAPLLVAAAPAPLPPELTQVQQHLAQTQSMVAGFSQTDRNGRVLTGTLTLKKPGKIRFQYQQGVPILIVGDGRALTFIDYSVRQVQRWPIGNSPLGILLNPNADISRVARLSSGGDPRFVSVEASDPRHPEYGRITMIFNHNASAPAGLMLQGWVALDAQNNRTTVRLSGQRFNVPVSDSTFQFRDPRSGGAARGGPR
jgi:outer membrane lipoprotein-sorting protein